MQPPIWISVSVLNFPCSDLRPKAFKLRVIECEIWMNSWLIKVFSLCVADRVERRAALPRHRWPERARAGVLWVRWYEWSPGESCRHRWLYRGHCRGQTLIKTSTSDRSPKAYQKPLFNFSGMICWRAGGTCSCYSIMVQGCEHWFPLLMSWCFTLKETDRCFKFLGNWVERFSQSMMLTWQLIRINLW